jgi:hypothetical protein
MASIFDKQYVEKEEYKVFGKKWRIRWSDNFFA